MSGNRLAGGIANVELNVQRHSLGGRASYSFMILYAGPTSIEIIPGSSLILTIDGDHVALDGDGSLQYREFILPGLLEEKAFYHNIDPALIRRICEAREVEVEVIGSYKTLKRAFSKRNFSHFNDFCRDYVP
jgi:hypothetical protein